MRVWLATVGTFLTGKVLPAAIIAAVGILLIQLVQKWTKRLLEHSRLEKAAYSLILSVVRVALYLILGLVLASKLGIDTSSVVALVSVLTLAVSLSVQNALSNVISGFMLLYNKPFKTGDYVEVAGQGGTVQEIGLSYTRLATPDNKHVSIPNSTVTAGQIVNFTELGTRRVDISVSAAYTAAVEDVLAALREAAQVETALAEPAAFSAVESYDESAIRYKLQFWCKAEDYWTALFAANQKIKAVFDEKGIEMTYPHLNVHLDRASN